MIPIKIIKHKLAVPLKEYGDILRPFEGWENTTTGGGWYSKVTDGYYDTQPYYPLSAIFQNPWDSLKRLEVECEEFKKQVEYVCPYNKYTHYWCVPVLVFTQDVKLWTARYHTPREGKYLDYEWMRKFSPVRTKNGLPFTKIQRALLGPGYTKMTSVGDGSGFLYDALVALDNDDFLGVKVWMWFNKSKS